MISEHSEISNRDTSGLRISASVYICTCTYIYDVFELVAHEELEIRTSVYHTVLSKKGLLQPRLVE